MASPDGNNTQFHDDQAGHNEQAGHGNAQTWNQMRRPRDDRRIAGVCAAVADHLGVDPVIIRVIVAVLALTGPIGWLAYGAGWILIPSADKDHSALAHTLNMERHESTLVLVGVIALAIFTAGWLFNVTFALSSPRFWAWPWLVLAALAWLIFFRPQKGQSSDSSQNIQTNTNPMDRPDNDNSPSVENQPTAARPKISKQHSPTLLALTLLVTITTLSATWLWSQFLGPVQLSTYCLIALAVVTAGILLGAWVGDAALLIPIGFILACALAVSLLPRPNIGESQIAPAASDEVVSTYSNGVGYLNLDLGGITDPQELVGRTINIKQGVGQIDVRVPAGIDVRVTSRVRIGKSEIFGDSVEGTGLKLTRRSGHNTSKQLNIHINQSIGEVQVK